MFNEVMFQETRPTSSGNINYYVKHIQIKLQNWVKAIELVDLSEKLFPSTSNIFHVNIHNNYLYFSILESIFLLIFYSYILFLKVYFNINLLYYHSWCICYTVNLTLHTFSLIILYYAHMHFVTTIF